MKKVNSFSIEKTDKGYSVFIFWDKKYSFTNLKAAKKFVAYADNYLFTEFYKLNEIYMELLPYLTKTLFISTAKEKIIILKILDEINETIKYIHIPRSSPDINVWIINKIKHTYSNLIRLNDFFFTKSKHTSDTINVYKTKIISERLYSLNDDFINFKNLDIDKAPTYEPKIVNLSNTLLKAI